jgi:hypothetical protein
MGSSNQVTGTGTVYNGPCKLIGIIVDPGSSDGSFTLRDGGDSGAIIAGSTKVNANGNAFWLGMDHDCRIDLHATISSCILYCIIR